jgi:hypothetical protein
MTLGQEEYTGCACIAASDLASLADLRRAPGLRVLPYGARVWVAWEGDGSAVLRRVLPLAGSEVFERREGRWYRCGCRLPSFDLPLDADDDVALSRALVPGPLRTVVSEDSSVRPLPLALMRTPQPQPATALRCRLDALGRWAERATSARLGALRGACAGRDVLLTGANLPPLTGVVRYWGNLVWAPLGYRPEPGLGESALRAALGISEAEVLVLAVDGYECVPRDAFRPLTRAGIRLAQERQREGGNA